MKAVLFRSALSCALSIVALSASAQQMKVESQGEAAVEAQKEALVAMSMSKAIGLPAPGKGQVVFFRSSTSPGAALDIHADGAVVGDLPAGMYFAGTRRLPARTRMPPPMRARCRWRSPPTRTYFVQVIRNGAGRPQMLHSTATKFQRATR
jgi:hypothetical protein